MRQYIKAFGEPVFNPERTFVHPAATLMGNVTLGELSSVWPGATVRGDGGGYVKIGSRTNIQEAANIHGGEPAFPIEIGDNVTIAHGAMVHGSKIGNNVCIGIAAVVLDGTVIPDNVIVGANSVVSSKEPLQSGWLYMGSPARPIKELSPKQIEWLQYNADSYVNLAMHALNLMPE